MPSIPRLNPVQDGNAITTFGFYPLDYYEIDAHANLLAGTGPGGTLATLIETIELTSTVEVLGQVGTLNLIGNNGNLSTTNGGVRVALSLHESWANATVLQDAIQAIGVNAVDGLTLANAVVYSFTF